jgi:hypothetical protein
MLADAAIKKRSRDFAAALIGLRGLDRAVGPVETLLAAQR